MKISSRKHRVLIFLGLILIWENHIKAKTASAILKKNEKTNKPHGNLAPKNFYQNQTRKSLIFKTPSQVNVSSVAQNVGDGLDLARASILPQNSSPHVVTSCIGNQVTLKCVAEGNPAPEFIWYKGKQAVSRNKVAEFDLNIAPSKFTRASHLTLTPNVKDDFGEYQCSATNTLGTTQQSTHRIVLNDKGEQLCTESAYNKDKKKFNSIVIGTFSSAGMIVVLLCVAAFVLWRVNQRESYTYNRLGSKQDRTENTKAGNGGNARKTNHQSNGQEINDEDVFQDDFDAKEIGRLSSLLAGDWERLARLLGFHQHDINAIREDSIKMESRCAEMLNRFRRKKGSRETLAECVEEMKNIETAIAIREKFYKTNPTD